MSCCSNTIDVSSHNINVINSFSTCSAERPTAQVSCHTTINISKESPKCDKDLNYPNRTATRSSLFATDIFCQVIASKQNITQTQNR